MSSEPIVCLTSSGTTVCLTYNVVGEECPIWVAKTCPLRKELSTMQDKYPDFGYVVLKNGNALVPEWWSEGSECGMSFNFNEFKREICVECHRDCNGKHRTNPEEYPWDVTEQVVMLPYQLSGTNCPSAVSIDDRQLRQQLKRMEKEKNIGYKQSPDSNMLLIPDKFWDPKTNVFLNVSQRCSDICMKCFERNRQR